MSKNDKSLDLTSAPLAEPDLASAPLAELEVAIERGLRGFLLVGRSLLAIQSRELYRPEYRSFNVYLQQRWTYTPRFARYLIEAAQIQEKLGNAVPNPPALSVRGLRELKLVCDKPEMMEKAVDLAIAEFQSSTIKGPGPTGPMVRRAVAIVENKADSIRAGQSFGTTIADDKGQDEQRFAHPGFNNHELMLRAMRRDWEALKLRYNEYPEFALMIKDDLDNLGSA